MTEINIHSPPSHHQVELSRWVGPDLIRSALFKDMRDAMKDDIEKAMQAGDLPGYGQLYSFDGDGHDGGHAQLARPILLGQAVDAAWTLHTRFMPW